MDKLKPETFKRLQRLSDELLDAEALAREAVSDVQMSLSRGKKDKYTSYNSVLSTAATLNKASHLIEDLKYLRDFIWWQAQITYGFGEKIRSLEGMRDELEKLESRINDLNNNVYQLLVDDREIDKVLETPTYKSDAVIAECWYEGEGDQVSCTGDVGASKLARETVELSERLLSSEPVRLLESEGRKLIESNQGNRYSIKTALMNIDELKNVLSTLRREQQLEWAPYSDALKLAYATEKLREKLHQLCEESSSLASIKWITKVGSNDYDEWEEEDIEGVERQKVNRLAEAMDVACTLEGLARDVASLKQIDGENYFVIQTKVRMNIEYIDAFMRAREELGRPVGWFIPNARDGEELSPTAVVNDLANYVHVIAEEIKKISKSTTDNCLLEQDTEPLLAEVCRSWSTSASLNLDDYSREDTPALIGYASGKKLYLRVGSASGHATVVEKKNGNARIEYYDTDEPVRKVMMSLLEDIVGCECNDHPGSGRSICSCPLETEENAVKLGAVISRATSMDYRYADYYYDIRDYHEQEYISEEEIREAAMIKLYYNEKNIVEDTIKKLLNNKRSIGNRITSTSNLLMAEIITR
ncbi:MAG: hypothetical protein ACP5IE_00045 [Infirmifilum sp.]